jgi:4-amino-4-deoxy-L-arabinose transferase-like glycosyltransferase/tetratricopeptide (TPR) repeat protein
MKKILNDNIALLAIVSLAIILRLWHINWGLPEVYEEATPFSVAWKMWHWGQAGFDFNPHFFNYPALTFYLNFLLQGVYYAVGHIIGWFPTVEAYHQANIANPSNWILFARILSVVFDIGTVTFLFFLSRLYLGNTAASFPALLAAVNPLLIKNAQIVNVDTPLTFFIVAALYCCYKLHDEKTLKWYLLAGASIGLAASSKYNGAFLLPVLLAAHLFRSKSIGEAIRSVFDVRLMSAAAIAIAVFVSLNPYILLSFGEFYKDFSFEETHMSAGHLGIDPTQGTTAFYLLQTLPNAVGVPMAIVIATSVIAVIVRFRKNEIILLLFPLLYLTILLSWNMRAERYLLPTIPSLLLVGTIGIVMLWRYLVSSGRISMLRAHGVRYAGYGIIGIMLLTQPVLTDVEYHRSLSLPDTRAVAKEWILQHIPPGAVIATLPIGIAIPESLYRIFPIPFLGVNIERMAQFYDTRWYEDFDIVIGSDFDYDRYLKDPQRYRHFLTYYDSLKSRFDLLYEVAPKGSQPGPGIRFYQPRQALEQAKFDEVLFRQLNSVPESIWVNRFLHNLAFMLIGKSKFGKAEQVFKEILSIETSDMNAQRSLVAVLVDQGKNDEALEQARKSLQSAPDDPMLVGLQGRVYARLQKFSTAESLLAKAIALNPRVEFPYDDLSMIYQNRNDKNKAIDILTRHLQILNPQSQKAKAVKADLESLRKISSRP